MMRGWSERIEASLRRAEAATDGLSEAQWHEAPDADSFSIAQILEHLTLSAEGVAGKLEEALARRGGSTATPIPWIPSWLERQLLRAVGPEAGGKTPVPKRFYPAARPETAGLVLRLRRAHERVMACEARATPADRTRVKAASAALPLLRVRLAAWLEVVAVHADYHVGQIERLRAALTRE